MRHVALLYSVVVTAARRVTSADLTAAGQASGFAGLTTVLSTGNLIFVAEGGEAALSARLSTALAEVTGRAVPVHLRDAAAFRALVAANPFADQPPAQVAVRVMDDDIAAATAADLARRCGPGERFAVTPRALWMAVPGALTGSPFLRAVNHARVGRGTSRSASALGKILAALGD